MIGFSVDHLGVRRSLNYVWDGPIRTPPHKLDASFSIDTAPPSMTIIKLCPEVTDQGQQGACTGHSAVAPYYIAEVHAGRSPVIVPSPAYMYYNERLLNGQTDQDAGASISDIYRAGNKYGICDKSLMPYDDSDFTTPPSQAAYDQGATIRAHTYAPIPQIDVNIIGCLHHNQAPVNYGIMVYPSFMAARDGNIPMPGDSEDAEGGHATDIVGYNRTAQPQPCDELQTQIPPMTFVFRNSWGILWGQKGYGFIPFAYVLNRQLASDLWFIRAI